MQTIKPLSSAAMAKLKRIKELGFIFKGTRYAYAGNTGATVHGKEVVSEGCPSYSEVSLHLDLLAVYSPNSKLARAAKAKK